MSNRHQLTETIIDQLAVDQKPSLDFAMHAWWVNLRSEGGMRLTNTGYEVFCNLNLEKFAFDIPPLLPKHLIALDQNLTCPYWLRLGRKTQIVLFGSKESVLMALYGDINRFVAMLLVK